MDRNEAIRIVRMCCPKIANSKCDFETAMRVLVPELKESEDERIRKAILELVKQSSHILNPMNQKSMIAWLEKQGEQKTAWSEEDEKNLYLITTAVEHKYSGELFLGKKQREIVCTGRNLLDWLYSLENRINSQFKRKAEQSEQNS